MIKGWLEMNIKKYLTWKTLRAFIIIDITITVISVSVIELGLI